MIFFKKKKSYLHKIKLNPSPTYEKGEKKTDAAQKK